MGNKILTDKQNRERKIANTFLQRFITTNYKFIEDQLDKPDVGIIIENKKIGIEVTEYHIDSESRPKEIDQLLNNIVAFHWIRTDTNPSFTQIINKTIKAERYNHSFDELWLLVVFQGGLPCQYNHSLAYEDIQLLQKLHNELAASSFNTVYLYFHSEGKFKQWNRMHGWIQEKNIHKSEIKSNDLWFKEILKDKELSENPVQKARSEAYKAIDEIQLMRRKKL